MLVRDFATFCEPDSSVYSVHVRIPWMDASCVHVHITYICVNHMYIFIHVFVHRTSNENNNFLLKLGESLARGYY